MCLQVITMYTISVNVIFIIFFDPILKHTLISNKRKIEYICIYEVLEAGSKLLLILLLF